jgi:hypothetical protein
MLGKALSAKHEGDVSRQHPGLGYFEDWEFRRHAGKTRAPPARLGPPASPVRRLGGPRASGRRFFAP